MIILPRDNADRTAALARMLRKKGARPRRMPRQIPPTALEERYSARLIAWVQREILPAFDELEDELPRLLASAHAEARIDGLRFDAGEGKKIRELMARARESMKKSLATPGLEKLAADFARETSSYQRIQLGKQTKAALGADIFLQDRRLISLMEAFVDTNVGLITKMSDEVAGRVETSVLRAVQDAKPWTEYRDELASEFGFSEHRAEVIARDQIGKFYGQANAARQRELGVTHFIWRTSGDERVRDEHEARNGERYSYEEPPDGELPGEPILCRCSAEPDFANILEEL